MLCIGSLPGRGVHPQDTTSQGTNGISIEVQSNGNGILPKEVLLSWRRDQRGPQRGLWVSLTRSLPVVPPSAICRAGITHYRVFDSLRILRG